MSAYNWFVNIHDVLVKCVCGDYFLSYFVVLKSVIWSFTNTLDSGMKVYVMINITMQCPPHFYQTSKKVFAYI